MKKMLIVLGFVLVMSILISIVFATAAYAAEPTNFGNSFVSPNATYEPGYLSAIVHEGQVEAAAADMNLGQAVKELKLEFGWIPGQVKK